MVGGGHILYVIEQTGWCLAPRVSGRSHEWLCRMRDQTRCRGTADAARSILRRSSSRMRSAIIWILLVIHI